MEATQSRNLNAPVSTNDEVSEKSSQLVTENHPLYNVVILDNIIGRLKYKDLKNLRLVCQRWNSVAENVFWKLSRIKVATKSVNLTTKEREEHAIELAEENQNLTDTFEITFPSPTGLPTNSILLKGYINRRTLEYFWKERGSSTLTSVYFLFFCEPTEESIDLNRYVTPMLTTLDISSPLQNIFTVSFKVLSNIQILKLSSCKILLDGKIAPRELVLRVCSVFCGEKRFEPYGHLRRYGGNEERILINDYVDFSRMKKLILEDRFWRLNVGSDTKELDCLALKRAELIGLGNSQWKANFVSILHSGFCIGDRMEIKTIPGIGTGDMGIESLPKTIEHLWFRVYGSLFSLPQPLIFAYPKLKSLKLQTWILRDIRILDFTNCTSLVDFQFATFPGVCLLDFNRIKLPNSIKNMKLSKVITNTDFPWQLDTLVLYNYKHMFASVERALRHFTTAKLLILLDSDLECQENQNFIINHWRNSDIEQLAFGYSDNEIQRCFLFTNKNSNETGEAIDWDKFEKLGSLNLHKDLLPFMVTF